MIVQKKKKRPARYNNPISRYMRRRRPLTPIIELSEEDEDSTQMPEDSHFEANPTSVRRKNSKGGQKESFSTKFQRFLRKSGSKMFKFFAGKR